MNLDDHGAVTTAVVYDALLTFITKLDLLSAPHLTWLEFRVSYEITECTVGSHEQQFLRAALDLVKAKQ